MKLHVKVGLKNGTLFENSIAREDIEESGVSYSKFKSEMMEVAKMATSDATTFNLTIDHAIYFIRSSEVAYFMVLETD